MRLPSPLHHLSLAGILMFASLAVQAQSQPAHPALTNMNAQLAKLGGTMHATARVCGDYTDDELAQQKQQQKAHMTGSGMDADGFEEAFREGFSEAEAKWESVPASERQAKCDQIKQEMRDAAEHMTQ